MEGGARVVPWVTRIEDHLAWPVLSQLPVTLTVRISLKRLRVRDLLRLEKGQVLESAWSQTSDVPVAAGEVRLCWGEFEVSGQQIGVRLTQLL
jgi:flagellar motor switch protein FliM